MTTATIGRPAHIDPQRWERAPWHAKQKIADAANRAMRPQAPVYLDPETTTPPDDLTFSAESLEMIPERGYRPEYIADHFNLSVGAIEARMRRAGRVDLCAPFSALRTSKRKKSCPGCSKLISHGSNRCQSCANRESQRAARERRKVGDAVCPTCGDPMTAVTSKGLPRKACSSKCGGALSGAGDSGHLSGAGDARRHVVDEVEHLTSIGESPAGILRALNTNPTALSRRLDRAGRPDLARTFDRIRKASA